MGVLEDVQAIRVKAQEVERQRAKREADKEQAQERRDEALAELKEQFDVETLEQAQELLDKMETELVADIERLKSELDEVTT